MEMDGSKGSQIANEGERVTGERVYASREVRPSTGRRPASVAGLQAMRQGTGRKRLAPRMRQYDHDDEEMYTEQVYRVTNAMPERYPRSRVRPDELVMEDTLEEEFKSGFEAGGVDEHVAMERLPQRVRYLKLNTTVLPDLIVPYLYGDRQSRINAIMDQTGCTIDYCPLSPEEQGQSPQSMSYMMNFLVSAETVPQLEAACKMLRNVVDRVQFHVQQKLAVASSMRRRSGSIRHEAPERIEDEVEYLHGGVYGSFVKAEPIVYDQMPPREYPHRYHQEMLLDDNDFDMEPMWMENRRYTVPDPSRRFRPVRTVYRRVPVYVDEDGYPLQSSVVRGRSRVTARSHSPRHPDSGLSSPGLPGQPMPGVNGQSDRVRAQVRASNVRSRDPSVPERAHHRQEPSDDIDGDEGMHNVRRGVKRRLVSPRTENWYYRRRPFRQGPSLYEYFSEDDDWGDRSVVGNHSDQRIHSHHVDLDDEATGPAEVEKLETDSVMADRSNLRHEGASTQTNDAPSDSFTSPPVTPGRVSDITRDVPVQSTTSNGDIAANNSSLVETSVGIAFRDEVQDSQPPIPDQPAERQPADAMYTPAPPAEQSSVACVPELSSKLSSESSHLEGIPPVTVGATQEFVLTSQDTGEYTSVDRETINDATADTSQDQNLLEPRTRQKATKQKMGRPLTAKTKIKKSRGIQTSELLMQQLAEVNQRETHRSEVFVKLKAQVHRVTLATKRWSTIQELQILHTCIQDLVMVVSNDQIMEPKTKTEALQVLDAAICGMEGSPALDISQVKKFRSAIELALKTCSAGIPVTSVCIKVPDSKAVEKLGSKSLPLGEVADSYGKSDLDAEQGIPDAVGIWSTDAMKSEEEVKRAVKEENHLEIPVEAPSYVSPFFNDMVNESSTSVAMVGAQRRLLRELAKSDPYYYVRPLKLTKGPRSIGSSSCSFGCFGGSSTKWERKVVSQVSSRMKWFDSVAYSLAKVSGGKELLSRKKMNSTIRKLHLVALQLHCLLSHLYCVRKRLKCREIDSLPTALNNSYHEKRMNGYKSRLKLMVHQPQLHSNVPEELLRDTFEFFPELLLCVDMWGNDLRDSVAEKPSDVLSLKIPRDLLERARSRVFDFEGDKNGLLQSICEELLNILCLWNDFKWGESLESLTINSIVTFEERVKSSIRKILGIHSTHLLATWSEKILARPDLLYHIRMTQPNVYYSDTVPTGVFFQSGDKSVSLSSSNQLEEECEDSSESNDSWIPQDKANDEPTSTVIYRLDDGLRPLRVHDLRSVAGKNLEQHVLKWSDVYNIRQQYQSLANNLGTFVRDPSTTESPSNILERIARSRNILNEAVQTSEKLALHSVGHQLPMELREGGEGGTLADIESTDDSADEAERRQNENANVDDQSPTETSEQRDTEMSPDVDEEESEPLDDQPDIKDLIEIVTSTNRDVTEICSQRSRSARVREKLQGQSVELARQSIQIFHNFLQVSNRS